MRKTWVIAAREYRTTVRTKTFLVVVLIMPVLMLGGIAVRVATEGRVDIDAKRIALIDHSGKMQSAIMDAAKLRNETAIYETREDGSKRQNAPKYEFVPQDASQHSDEQLLELSDQIRNKKLFAFVEISEDILTADPATNPVGLRYYSNQPTYTDIYRWMNRVVNNVAHTARLEAANIDRETVDRALAPIELDNLGLLSKTATGEIQQAERVDQARMIIPALGLMMLMWMSLVVTVQPMLNCILEEKMQRISEVLLGSIPPFELMMGKLIGYVFVSITLIGVYLAGGYVIAGQYGYADIIPLGLLGWFFIFQVLAIMMFGSMFIAAGSCCNDFREAQHMVMPIWLPMMIPMFCLGIVLEHPDSLFSTVISLFPPATPMLMVMRQAMPPGVPLWQLLTGMAGTIITTFVCVWAAGRIFRVGLLMSGKPPKLTELARWAIKG